MKRLMQFMEDDVPAVLMAVMVIVLSAEVFSRYLLGHSIVGASEIAQICLIWQVYLAAVGVMRRRRHVAVDVLRDRLAGRARAILDMFTGLVMGAVLTLATWQAFKFVTHTKFSPLPATGLSRGWLAAAVLVSAVGMLVHVVLQLAASWRGMGDESYRAEAGSIGDLDDLERGKATLP
ncbi:hypothetical protein ATER59S_00872 [Aquamicrobium terrae]